MQLIADRNLGSVRDKVQAFIVDGCLIFEAAEIRPGSVEAAGHSYNLPVEGAHIPDPTLEMRITPAAGGQRFNFDVRVISDLVPQANHDARYKT